MHKILLIVVMCLFLVVLIVSLHAIIWIDNVSMLNMLDLKNNRFKTMACQ